MRLAVPYQVVTSLPDRNDQVNWYEMLQPARGPKSTINQISARSLVSPATAPGFVRENNTEVNKPTLNAEHLSPLPFSFQEFPTTQEGIMARLAQLHRELPEDEIMLTSSTSLMTSTQANSNPQTLSPRPVCAAVPPISATLPYSVKAVEMNESSSDDSGEPFVRGASTIHHSNTPTLDLQDEPSIPLPLPFTKAREYMIRFHHNGE